MDATVGGNTPETLRALPGDEARRIMWRFAGRQDLAGLVRSVREVARGPVARLVASGGRDTHEWTAEKQALLEAFDRAGITAAYVDPEEGGTIDGPKNLALALVAFELAWVDAGAAIGNLAQHLALAPIRERGTAEQRRRYMSAATGAGGQPVRRGAFALTEPIPYAGVETGLLGGKVRVAEWKDGEEPLLQVDKRGRFITNMAFADFVTAAVESADPADQGQLPGDPREGRSGRLRPRHAHAQAGAPAVVDARPRLQPAGAGQPHRRRLHGARRRDRSAPQAQRRSSKRSSAGRGSRWA